MEITQIIFIICILTNAIFEACMDKLLFHYHESIFTKLNPLFWNSEISWKNKYKEDLKTPKFFGSTTFFVSLTDGWHLMKWLFNISFSVALIFAFSIKWYWIIVLLFIRRIVFEITFRLLKRKRGSI